MRFTFLFALTTLTLPALAQNMNVAAVDTLTKDVAIAVFDNIVKTGNQPVAEAVYEQLLLCDDGCDPQEIIRQTGGSSWSQVGQKMQELAMLKMTQRFREASPAEANAAIRQQLTGFYVRHKAMKPYSVPLTAAVQAAMLVKIDRMLPPAPDTVAQTSTDASQMPGGTIDNESNISPSALAMSKLERSVKDEQDKNFWTMIVSGLIGLITGAGAVYFLLYRTLKSETDQLKGENAALSRENDTLRRKPANDPRPRNTPRPDLYDPQLRSTSPIEPTPGLTPVFPASAPVELPVVPTQPLQPSEPAATAEPTPALPQTPEPPRDEVLYFPPPSPAGIFDGAQQNDRISPESAYRFEVRSQTPDQAQFRFEAETGRVARFLTYRNYMIEPACDSENSYASQYTRIITQREGEAVRENGGWRVVKKALIRYE
ncbi:MAG: hypothetical protein H7319_14860 [Spirosoma sp.]|nr:hypothetical protein [Spirosoma sp.]